jgi:hypothetical protein
MPEHQLHKKVFEIENTKGDINVEKTRPTDSGYEKRFIKRYINKSTTTNTEPFTKLLIVPKTQNEDTNSQNTTEGCTYQLQWPKNRHNVETEPLLDTGAEVNI